VDAAPVSPTSGSRWPAPNQRTSASTVATLARLGTDVRRPDRRYGLGGGLFGTQKKRTGKWSAQGAAIGARTLKTGQSKFFLGYKKHTFRLWLSQYQVGVLLVPLVSWIAPANRSEGGFLRPSIGHCQSRWLWHPDLVVADMGYIDAASKRQIRERWQMAVVTRLKENMNLVSPFETPEKARKEIDPEELKEYTKGVLRNEKVFKYLENF
jgi:hypothetical protein